MNIEIIKNKILNQEHSYTFLERRLICYNDELKELFVQNIINNGINSEDEYKIVDYLIGKLLIEDNKEIAFSYICYTIDHDINIYGMLTPETEKLIDDPSKIEIINNKILSKLDTNPITDKTYLTASTLKLLLDHKRFDIISQIGSNKIVETYDEKSLIKEYPFTEYPFPYHLINGTNLLGDKIKYIDLNFLVNYSQRDLHFLEGIDSKMVLSKLDNKNEIMKLNIENNYDNIHYFLITISNDYHISLDELHMKFAKHGNYMFASLLTDEEFENIKPQMLKEIKENEYSLKTFILALSKTYQYDLNRVMCREVIDILLSKKEYDTVLRYLNKTSHYQEYISSIIDAIKNNELDISTLSCSITNYKEIVDYLIQNEKLDNFVLTYTQDKETRDKIIAYYQNHPNINIKFGNTVLNKENIKFYVKFINGYNFKYFKDLCSNYQDDWIKEVLDDAIVKQGTKAILENDELADEYFDLLNKTIFKKEPLLKIYLSKDIYFILRIIAIINHNEEYQYLYNDEFYSLVKEKLSSYYNYPLDKLDLIYKYTGPSIIRYIENENIKKLMNLDNDNIEKICNLIKPREYTMIELEASYDSIRQYEFSKTTPEVTQIFNNILESIKNNTNEYRHLIKEIIPYLDDKFYIFFNKKYELPGAYNNSPKNLITLVIGKIKENGPKSRKYINILHDITDYYIAKKREELQRNYHIKEDLDIPYDYDHNSLVNALVEIYIKEYIRVQDEHNKIVPFKNQIITMMKPYCSKEVTLKIIDYLQNTNGIPAEKDIKPFIPMMKNKVKEYINTNFLDVMNPRVNFEYYKIKEDIDEMGKKGLIKKKYYIPTNECNPCENLVNLRLDILEEYLLPNEEMYSFLTDLLDKKKFLFTPQIMIDYINSRELGLNYNSSHMISFINYFYKIYSKEKNITNGTNNTLSINNFSLPRIITNANTYGGISTIYSLILGEEDARLIAANDGPNSAEKKIKNNERLDESVALTLTSFKRQEITIPTFNEVIKINDKLIRVIVGNLTHPSNLTHGERTGSCMRIGGIGESLLKYAIESENGFQIRFEDARTGEYVSRVTGFRNGNTVFLNQIRNSCSENITNTEVFNACKEASSKLIEYSSTSTLPIDNVVVSHAYATMHAQQVEQDLGVENIRKGLKYFYTDVSEKAIILASTGNPYKKINLNNTNMPIYQPAREEIKAGNNPEDFISIINRVTAIKNLLNGVNFNELEPITFENGFQYGAANTDWYIYVDKDNNIYSDIINIDNRAQIEFNKIMKEIKKEYKKDLEERNNIYGRKNR